MSTMPKVMHHPKFMFYHLLLASESDHHGNRCEASYILYLDCVGTTRCKVFPLMRKCQFCMFVKGVALLLKATIEDKHT